MPNPIEKYKKETQTLLPMTLLLQVNAGTKNTNPYSKAISTSSPFYSSFSCFCPE